MKSFSGKEEPARHTSERDSTEGDVDFVVLVVLLIVGIVVFLLIALTAVAARNQPVRRRTKTRRGLAGFLYKWFFQMK